MDNTNRPDPRLEASLCPITGKPCKAGSPADCEHFWECVRQALELRQAGPADRPKPVAPADPSSA